MTPQQAIELLPCLHCGSTDITEGSGGDSLMFAECQKCGATGPTALTRAEAFSAWNRRAPAPTSEPGASIRDHEDFREDLLRLSTTQHRQTLKAIRKDIYDTIDRRVANAVAAALATPASPAPCTYPACDCDQDHACGPVGVPAAPLVAQASPVCETGAPGSRIYRWFKRVPQGTMLYQHPAPEASPLVEDAQLSGNSGELVEGVQRIVADINPADQKV